MELRLPWRPPRIRRNVPSFGHHYWRLLEEGRPRNAPHGHGHRQWDTLPLPPPPPNNNNHHHPLIEIKKTQSFHIMYSIVSFWGKFMTKFFLVIYKASPNCNAFLVSKLINMYKCVLKIRTLYQSIWQSFHLIFRWQHSHRCRVYSLASPCKYDKEFFHYQKEVQ